MQFTGERYTPSESGRIRYEHLHRYALSLAHIQGKSVLDLACGEGYGASLMAGTAQCVIGVDIDPETVRHAAEQYQAQKNLRFLAGSADAVPLPDQSVEVVTSFETIEHHDKHEEMLREIKRVLTPGGLLIISSPNRKVYSDEAGYVNPFHVKELYYEELVDLLRRHFQHMHVAGQQLAAASFVFPLQESAEEGFQALIESAENHQVTPKAGPIAPSKYFIAICSDDLAALPQNTASVYFNDQDDLLKELEAELAQVRAEFQSAYADRLQKYSELESLWSQFQQVCADRDAFEAELRKTQVKLSDIQASRFWKLRHAFHQVLKRGRALGPSTSGK